MKKYRVYCWKTYFVFYDVEAENKKEAELKADELQWNGEHADSTREPFRGIGEIEELKQ